jgi:hypothetical protein
MAFPVNVPPPNTASDTRVSRPALVFDEISHPTGLERAAHLVEGVAVIAHDLARLGDVAKLLGQLQQRQLAFGTLRQSSNSGFS